MGQELDRGNCVNITIRILACQLEGQISAQWTNQNNCKG